MTVIQTDERSSSTDGATKKVSPRRGWPRRGTLRPKSSRTLNVFAVGAVAYVLAVSVYPTVYSVITSLHNSNLSMPFLKPQFVGAANYTALFHDGELLSSVYHTLVYMVSIVVELVMGFLLAWAAYQNSHVRGMSHMRALISLPLFMPFFVSGMLWRYMLSPGYGVVPNLLAHTPLGGVYWIENPTTIHISLDIVDIWQWTPFVFLVFVAALTSVPHEQLDSAMVDGASTWQSIRWVVLPLLKPAIVIAVVFRFILTFQNFDTAYALNYGGPATSSELITLYLYKVEFILFDTSYGAALAILILVVVVLLGQLLSFINLDRGSSAE